MGGLLGKFRQSNARRWFSIGYCPTESLNWPRRPVLPGWRPAFVFADECTTHGVKSRCDSSENGFPKENDGRGHDRLLLVLVPKPSAVQRVSTALTCVDPSGRRNAGPGSILHQQDECRQSSHTTEAFSWKNRSLETVQAKKRTHGLTMPRQPLHWTWSNMRQEWGNSEEQKSLPSYQSKHEPPFEMSAAEFRGFFCPQWRNFARKLAQGDYKIQKSWRFKKDFWDAVQQAGYFISMCVTPIAFSTTCPLVHAVEVLRTLKWTIPPVAPQIKSPSWTWSFFVS